MAVLVKHTYSSEVTNLVIKIYSIEIVIGYLLGTCMYVCNEVFITVPTLQAWNLQPRLFKRLAPAEIGTLDLPESTKELLDRLHLKVVCSGTTLPDGEK